LKNQENTLHDPDISIVFAEKRVQVPHLTLLIASKPRGDYLQPPIMSKILMFRLAKKGPGLVDSRKH
jgi:hypothetical protein